MDRERNFPKDQRPSSEWETPETRTFEEQMLAAYKLDPTRKDLFSSKSTKPANSISTSQILNQINGNHIVEPECQEPSIQSTETVRYHNRRNLTTEETKTVEVKTILNTGNKLVFLCSNHHSKHNSSCN